MSRKTPEQLLQIAKDAKCKAIQLHCKTLMDKSASEYSAFEAAVWGLLLDECKQYQADGTVGPYMQAEIGARYSDATELSNAVMANAAALRELRAGLIKARQMHEMAVDALSTIDEVQQYNHLTDWLPL